MRIDRKNAKAALRRLSRRKESDNLYRKIRQEQGPML
jgi:hypothetical protein